MVRTGDNVRVRDALWRVSEVKPLGSGKHLVSLMGAGDGGRGALTVVSPPEVVEPVAGTDLALNPNAIGPFAPWMRSHINLELTARTAERELYGARYGRVNLEAYQIAPTLRVLTQPRPRLLIADDVGLGKTIEAGLCCLELMARGRAERILVVVPPGLIDQWADELLEKFGLEFEVIDNAAGLARAQTKIPAGVSPWSFLPRIITSMEYVKKQDVCQQALNRRWSLVIVDEAHALAESGSPRNPYRTQRARMGEKLRDHSDGLLLLTATPHNGYRHSFRSLIELVEPTAATFGGSSERTRGRVDRARIRRLKSQIMRPGNNGEWVPVFPRRHVKGIPVKLSDDEAALFAKVSGYCSRTARGAEGTDDAELVSFAMQIVKKRMLSSRRALLNTVQNRLDALTKQAEREDKPTRSEIRELQASLPLSERVAERIAQQVLRSAVPKEEKRRRSEARKLREIRRDLRKLEEGDPKTGKLLAVLRRLLRRKPDEKFIVFTEYLDTLAAIGEAIEQDKQLSGRTVVLKGGMSRKQRRRAQQAFGSPDVSIMLATDAASEGLNLQRHCRFIIHVELPWNPNRLEQRNGRVDRYGQERQPKIRFLHFANSPEDNMLRQLVRKIEQMHEDRVSTPDILGVLSAGDLEGALVDINAESAGESDVQVRLTKVFDEPVDEFERGMKPLLASSEDPREEIRQIDRLLHSAQPLIGDDLAFESLLKEALGDALQPIDGDGLYRIEVPRSLRGPNVTPCYPRATCRRSVAVRHPADEVEYITPLHPLVQALGQDAYRRMIQAYEGSGLLRARRIAVRRSDRVDRPSVLFTFWSTIDGSQGIVEQRIVPVVLGLDGQAVGNQGLARELLFDSRPPEEVATQDVTGAFGPVFDELYGAARGAAEEAQSNRLDQLRKRREEQAEALRQDLATYAEDRRREIDEEEEAARQVVEARTRQLRLFGRESVTGFDARRAAVDTFVRRREEEIESFAQIEASGLPEPIGALIVVPQAWEAGR